MKTRNFRNLNESELEALLRVARRHPGRYHTARFKAIKVAYRHEDNFTLAVVTGAPGLRVGVAKRNPTDADNPETGQTIALIRAVRSASITLD